MLVTKNSIKRKSDKVNHHEKRIHEMETEFGKIYFTNSVKDTMSNKTGRSNGGSRIIIDVSKCKELLDIPEVAERVYIDRFSKKVNIYWDSISFSNPVVKGTAKNGFNNVIVKDKESVAKIQTVCDKIVEKKFSSFLDYQVVCARELSLYKEEKIAPKEVEADKITNDETVKSLREANRILSDENKMLRAEVRTLKEKAVDDTKVKELKETNERLMNEIKLLEEKIAQSSIVEKTEEECMLKLEEKTIEEKKVEQVNLEEEYDDFDFDDDNDDIGFDINEDEQTDSYYD